MGGRLMGKKKKPTQKRRLETSMKKEKHHFRGAFMERVTRLELATSTLARWRSTG